MNSTKVQGPALSVKFLGVVWSGKTKVIPEAVVDKVQAFRTPTTVAFPQEFLGILGYWRVFILHLVQILKPLYQLVGKGVRWDWDETYASAFTTAKWAVKAMQALSVIDPSRPCELDVYATEDGYGWGLWQWLERTHQPVGFWAQLWKGAAVHFDRKTTGCHVSCLVGYRIHHWNGPNKGNNHLSHLGVGMRLDPKPREWCGTNSHIGQVGCLPTPSECPL